MLDLLANKRRARTARRQANDDDKALLVQERINRFVFFCVPRMRRAAVRSSLADNWPLMCASERHLCDFIEFDRVKRILNIICLGYKKLIDTKSFYISHDSNLVYRIRINDK